MLIKSPTLNVRGGYRILERDPDKAKVIVEGTRIYPYSQRDIPPMLREGMIPSSAIVGLAIENTWAVDLVNAIHAEGGEMAFNFRVPTPIVEEAFASLS